MANTYPLNVDSQEYGKAPVSKGNGKTYRCPVCRAMAALVVDERNPIKMYGEAATMHVIVVDCAKCGRQARAEVTLDEDGEFEPDDVDGIDELRRME